ncbi:MAG: hypothetical protein KA444_01795 [Bacteroidia bacterium]|nr:hypothetical protein [Bacteroidia bacterium]
MPWILVCICFLFFNDAGFAQDISNESRQRNFYLALLSEDIHLVEQQIADLNDFPKKDTLAFHGVLQMKKAGLISKAKLKLSNFKDGKHKLESAIIKDSDNIEYRFLRLIIQENAPKILNYKGDLDADKSIIVEKFDQLNEPLKKEVKKYSRQSKVLKSAKFE